MPRTEMKLTRGELDVAIKRVVETDDNHTFAHLSKKAIKTVLQFSDPEESRMANRDMEDIIKENEANFEPLPDLDEPKKKRSSRRRNGD